MHLREAVVSSLGARRAAGLFPLHFLRAAIPEGRRVAPGAWKALLSDGRPIVQVTVRAGDATRPYHPLLDLARERWLSLDPGRREAVISSVRLHHRHARIFREWLETGTAERDDDFFRPPAEFDFERGRFFRSFADLLAALWDPDDAPTVVLENFELAGLPLAAFLLWAMENEARFSLALLCVFNRDSVLSSHWQADFRQRFFNQLERFELVQHFPLDLETEEDPEALPDAPRDLPRDISLSRCFLAYEEAGGFPGLQDLPRAEAAKAGYDLGMIDLMTGEVKAAMLSLSEALEKARQAGDAVMMARVNAGMALCDSRVNDVPSLDKHMALARKLAEEAGHAPTILLLDFSRFMFQESYTQDPANAPAMRAMEARMEAAGKLDLLLALRSNISYYESVIATDGWQAAYDLAQANLALSEEMDNLYQVSKLHHVVAWLCQLKGRGDEAIRHFDQCIAFRKELGAVDELVRAYNGVGYLCFTIGKFKASLSYFEKSLELLEPQHAYIETCLTLFNIVNIYFFTGMFSGAQDVMERILAVLDNLKLDSLPFHPRKKLYSFAGCAAFLRNQKTLALDYWNAALREPAKVVAGAAFPLLKSFMARTLEDDRAAAAALEEALAAARSDGQGYFTAFILMERAQAARARGAQEKAAADFAAASALVDSNGLNEMRPLLEHLRSGKAWRDYSAAAEMDGRIKTVSLGLTDSARQEAANMVLLKKLNDISFLKDFQDAVTRDLEEKDLYRTAMTLIKRNFPFTSFYLMEDRLNPSIMEGWPRKRRPDPAWAWDALFGAGGQAEMIVKPFPGGSLMAYPFSFNQERGLWAVMTTQSDDLQPSREETEIVTLALRHMDLTLDLHRAKEALKLAVARDNLTGALSRQEFMSRVERERQRHQRYSKDGQAGFSIIFMDLDNFKHYNDSYGHPVGDFILKAFARMVLLCVRELDSLGRWGGDEFVVLLPSTDAEGARFVANRILQSMKEADGFRKELEAELGHKIHIAPERRLGCSIGVAVFEPASPVEVDELIEAADKALYAAKGAGKGMMRMAGEGMA